MLPICFTLPPLEDIIAAPQAQALPYIFNTVMGSPGGGLGLIFLVLVITVFCSISITVAASRTTWAFARDKAIPMSWLWARVDEKLGVPVWALVLTTVVQMLLGLINLGSSSAFVAFVSVGVIGLAVSYLIPIVLSLLHGRREVNQARWKMPSATGFVVNVVAVVWILFEAVLFSMPGVIPVTEVSMNYASVVLVGFGAIAAVWYFIHARKGKQSEGDTDLLVLITLQSTKDHQNLMDCKDKRYGFNGGEAFIVMSSRSVRSIKAAHTFCLHLSYA